MAQTKVQLIDGRTSPLVFPSGNGTNGQYLQGNGAGALSWATVSGLPAQVLTLGTAVASTSGTSIDFTGIPSTVKRITVMFSGVSTNGTSDLIVQIGANSFTTSGYSSYTGYVVNDANANSRSITTGFGIYNGNAANTQFGNMIITNITSNTWVSSYSGGTVGGSAIIVGGGSVALSGTLDRVRLTTVNGTDTFDAGTINIMYEG